MKKLTVDDIAQLLPDGDYRLRIAKAIAILYVNDDSELDLDNCWSANTLDALGDLFGPIAEKLTER